VIRANIDPKTAIMTSERFKETARKVGADESSDAFERTLSRLAPPKKRPEKS
jgi:hypothetical protein